MQNLIEKCSSDDPGERPTFEEIFNWLSNFDDKNSEVENNEFFLDNVDIDVVKDYVEKITQITDNTEKLKNAIVQLKKENKLQQKKIEKIEKEKETNGQLKSTQFIQKSAENELENSALENIEIA